MEPFKPDGQVAYEAYGEVVDWKTVGGTPMPPWEAQSDRLRAAWNAAAFAVRSLVEEEMTY